MHCAAANAALAKRLRPPHGPRAIIPLSHVCVFALSASWIALAVIKPSYEHRPVVYLLRLLALVAIMSASQIRTAEAVLRNPRALRLLAEKRLPGRLRRGATHEPDQRRKVAMYPLQMVQIDFSQSINQQPGMRAR